MLVAIVVFNFSQFEVVFRDLSIAAASLALALDAWGQFARPAVHEEGNKY